MKHLHWGEMSQQEHRRKSSSHFPVHLLDSFLIITTKSQHAQSFPSSPWYSWYFMMQNIAEDFYSPSQTASLLSQSLSPLNNPPNTYTQTQIHTPERACFCLFFNSFFHSQWWAEFISLNVENWNQTSSFDLVTLGFLNSQWRQKAILRKNSYGV